MRFRFEDACIDTSAIQDVSARLEPYMQIMRRVADGGIYETPESSINAPADTTAIEALLSVKNQYCSPSLRYVFVVGIGGSTLGTKAVYDALRVMGMTQTPVMIFLEGPDPFTLAHIEKNILPQLTSPEEVLLIVVSKSGTTTETVANFAWLYAQCQVRFGDVVDRRVVVISDENTRLTLRAKQKGWGILPIPHSVGGRFSVFTVVGLFPLACVGVDISQLVAGALEGREVALAGGDNPYRMRAVTRFLWYTAGYHIETLFLFHECLRSLCGWHRQLTAESLGKKNTAGKPIMLFPDIAHGPEDLHSTFQLYFGALNNQSTTFLDVEETPSISIPESVLVEGIVGKQMRDVLSAIEQGVQATYRNTQKPFVSIQLARLSAHEIGMWMQGTMIETMLLAQLFEVNAFDQPNVEIYKQETRALLAQ